MRDIFTEVKFTMKDMVKRKSFIISTLIILTFIVVGFNVPNLIKSFNGDNSGNKLLIIDSKNVFEGTLENLKQMDLGYEFEITNEDLKFEDVKKKIENEEIKENVRNKTVKVSEKYNMSIAGVSSIIGMGRNPFIEMYPSRQPDLIDAVYKFRKGQMDKAEQEGYQEAKRYFEAQGDLNVPINYVSPDGYALGKWVKRQRYTRQNPEKAVLF